MGQSSSSSRPPITHHNSTVHDDCGPSPTSNHPPASSSMEGASNRAANSVEVEAPLPPGPSRRPIRRSLLSFVKPSSRPSARETSLGSSTPNRRSWLNPRRWSKVPSTLTEHTDEATHTRNDGPSDIPSPPIDRKGKGREEYEAGDAQDVHHSSPLSQQPTVSGPSTSNLRTEQAEPSPALPAANETSVIPSAQRESNSEQDPSEQQGPIPPPIEGGAEPAHDNLATASTAAVTSISGGQAQNVHEPPNRLASTAAPTSPAPATARPLPPPGTLVVVQGVVHTTDVPRSNGQTMANGTNGDSVNHRMSMPPRPRSSDPTFNTGEPHSTASAILSNGQQPDPGNLNTHETSDVGASSADNRDRGSGDVPILSSNVVESAGHPTQPASTGDSGQNTTQQNGTGEQRGTNHLANEDLGSPGSISSSSIDVLGTLLSVAAAATAASLLTGSSEPILPINHSSGLHNQANSPTTLPTGSGTPPDFSAASRAERMRNAWSSIRERLGIRPSTSPDIPTSNNNAAPGSAVPASPDTREMMLSEMARAFSVGLGLGGFTGPAANTNNNVLNRSTEAPATPEPRLPPAEGSFERFLVDLQADLRNALTTGEGGSGVRAMVAGVGWSDANSTESQTRQEASVSSNGAENHASDTAARSETHSDNAVSARPATSEPEPESDVTPSGEPLAEPLRQRTGGNREERQPGEPSRINWWRLYRFPAIGVPRNNLAVSVAAAAALSTAGPTSAAVPHALGAERPAPTSSVFENPSAHPEPEARNASDSRNGNGAAPQDNTVVPVIIVGLQSVHMDLRHGGEHPEADTNSTHNSDATGDLDEDIFGPMSDQDSNADALEQSSGPQVANAEGNPRRGTRWRSRAADAIRNLRPRRGGDQRNGGVNGDAAAPHLVQQMPPMGPGSRMFLIYVIGGYYPPNHSIVLGNPGDLESFEALSELAELLGQVKPSTATKEDIEKSGLQVIKATQVRQHEREGKITNNCAERCLICLDDYRPEEDVRMMACRHAFHKDCVDKWLQTGKNNCPACRSRGVSTDARSPFFS
ncbi:hypothetical protein M378DRAFT_108977 [Amanita muscaria Koide BX008]|uniref:RING-type domain-containing protein n=1 Tax=Amanita muscaria (strain Koide BX008) TaxID=946122 RepID=A0A0C2SFP8_AMAMK|nr:hypothetical protein M378DRAFT_108977 [Amanita muscaria Koide BX008]